LSCSSKSSFKKLASPPVYPASSCRTTKINRQDRKNASMFLTSLFYIGKSKGNEHWYSCLIGLNLSFHYLHVAIPKMPFTAINNNPKQEMPIFFNEDM